MRNLAYVLLPLIIWCSASSTQGHSFYHQGHAPDVGFIGPVTHHADPLLVQGTQAAPVTIEQIRRVQAALNASGFNVGTPDGVLGQLTRGGIASWQWSKGYDDTGTLTLDQLAELLDVYTKRVDSQSAAQQPSQNVAAQTAAPQAIVKTPSANMPPPEYILRPPAGNEIAEAIHQEFGFRPAYAAIPLTSYRGTEFVAYFMVEGVNPTGFAASIGLVDGDIIEAEFKSTRSVIRHLPHSAIERLDAAQWDRLLEQAQKALRGPLQMEITPYPGVVAKYNRAATGPRLMAQAAQPGAYGSRKFLLNDRMIVAYAGFNLDENMRVTQVVPGSRAQLAGLQVGDVWARRIGNGRYTSFDRDGALEQISSQIWKYGQSGYATEIHFQSNGAKKLVFIPPEKFDGDFAALLPKQTAVPAGTEDTREAWQKFYDGSERCAQLVGGDPLSLFGIEASWAGGSSPGLTVDNVIPGGPADGQIRAGDLLIARNGDAFVSFGSGGVVTVDSALWEGYNFARGIYLLGFRDNQIIEAVVVPCGQTETLYPFETRDFFRGLYDSHPGENNFSDAYLFAGFSQAKSNVGGYIGKTRNPYHFENSVCWIKRSRPFNYERIRGTVSSGRLINETRTPQSFRVDSALHSEIARTFNSTNNNDPWWVTREFRIWIQRAGEKYGCASPEWKGLEQKIYARVGASWSNSANRETKWDELELSPPQ